uniref:Uncharacterized protein n=1 Tax=Arundo donax TaxID=35708 RepID=A0A0A9BG27_ARUDO
MPTPQIKFCTPQLVTWTTTVLI